MKTALTIGFFDGVHIGHQALLQKLRSYPHATILTFSNHPKSLLQPPAPALILSYEERLSLLKPYADELIVLPFTAAFATHSYEELLSRFSLSHLLLGAGSTFGKNREGDPEKVNRYGTLHGFTVEYFPKVLFAGEPVSSSRIRLAIRAGDKLLVQQLLGRK